MHIYNNVLKLVLSAVVLSAYGCQTNLSSVTTNVDTNGISANNQTNNAVKPSLNSNSQYPVKDWRSSRFDTTLSKFSVKSASDNLKVDGSIDVFPQPTNNKYLIDPDKLINSNNTTPSGRLTTDPTTNEVKGTLTYFGLDTTKKSELSVGDKVLILATGETLTIKELLPETYIISFKDAYTGVTIPKGTAFISKSEKDGDVKGTVFKDLVAGAKQIELLITTDNKKLEKEFAFASPFDTVKIESDKAAIAPQKFISTTTPKYKTTDSAFKIVVSGNNRAKSFSSTASFAAMELNNPTITTDNVLYYTSNNTTGPNFFAVGTDGTTIWENEFPGDFQGAAPTISAPSTEAQAKGISAKTYLNKRVMYVASKSGEIFCVNSDGRIVSSIKINDSFKNSVWVDADDQNIDYVYAASSTGNLYRLKLDFSNSQSQVFSSVYSVKVADTSFSSSPILNNSSLYLGGENGVLYEIIPNTGNSSREWDLTKYTNNGSAKIVGIPVFSGNIAIVPAGGYLFRIVGSTVTQSPLLELKQGLASRIKPYGTVFQTNDKPSGNIISSPVVANGKAYISNGNAIFESDIQSVDSFKNYSTYCLSISGRLDDSDNNIQPFGNGNLDLSPVSTDLTQNRIGMVDNNTANNNSPYLNFFSLPLSSSSDAITGYMPLNEFDSKGRAITGYGSNVVADGKGNVYLTLDNGSVNVVPTR